MKDKMEGSGRSRGNPAMPPPQSGHGPIQSNSLAINFEFDIRSREVRPSIRCHQMSDFKAKMHQIRFPLGLRPRPHWGSLQRSPDPLPVFKGPTFKGSGRERKGRGGEERKVESRVGEGLGELAPNWGVRILQ